MSIHRIVLAIGCASTAFLVIALAQESAPPSTPPAAAEEKIAAVVGSERITDAELSNMVQSRLQGQPVPPDAMKEIRKMILESMIDGRLVAQFVTEKKIEADAKEVEAAIADIKRRVAEAGVPFAQVLQSQNLTEQTLRERIGQEMAFQKYAESQLTDEKLQEHFAKHKKEFDGTEVRASHILIKTEDASTDLERKAAAEKIASIRQEIIQGLDFAEAARKYSSCPSSAQGGDLGFFGRHGQMVEPFAAEAFTLPVGQVSQPVETQFGYHLIKVTETKPGEQSFEEAKDALKQVLFQEVWQSAAEQQRKVTKVEIRQG